VRAAKRTMNSDELKAAIHHKTIEIASAIGHDAAGLRFDESIPASGMLDSAGLLELIVWIETQHGLSIPEADLNVENLGTIDAIARYLRRARLSPTAEKIAGILNDIRPEFDFADSDDFIGDGMLDSFDVVTLVADLDKAYGISIEGVAIVPENFQNLTAIEKLLQKYGVP
jgi:acyl carrier protein